MDSKSSSCFRTRSSSHYSVFWNSGSNSHIAFLEFRSKPISRIPDPIPVPGFRIRHNLNPAFRITLLRFGILNKALIGSQIPVFGHIPFSNPGPLLKLFLGFRIRLHSGFRTPVHTSSLGAVLLPKHVLP